MADVNNAHFEAADGLRLPKVDREADMLLHEQVAASIRRAITDREALPGEKIPHAKDLAAILGVNTNTVLRAIRLLRDEGLLEAGRGKAITVAGTPERGALITRINELIALGNQLGYPRDELINLMRTLP